MGLIVLSDDGVFGPTIQGEGIEVGRPCIFVRLQGCPVRCPGCDTHYTWDGTEHGEKIDISNLRRRVAHKLTHSPGCGVVVSGGEPLIHWRNGELAHLFQSWRDRENGWCALETSGYFGATPVLPFYANSSNEAAGKLWHFLRSFTTVHLSPKITPCLHGCQSDDELELNVPAILDVFRHVPRRLALKFVVKDVEDVDAVDGFLARHQMAANHRIFLMPYGIHVDEVRAGCEFLVPILARRGWDLSPRVHSLLWGAKRGV